jgi:hypothetical protein
LKRDFHSIIETKIQGEVSGADSLGFVLPRESLVLANSRGIGDTNIENGLIGAAISREMEIRSWFKLELKLFSSSSKTKEGKSGNKLGNKHHYIGKGRRLKFFCDEEIKMSRAVVG